MIREIIECANVKIEKVDGKENAADPFTKALDIKDFDKHKWELGMKFMNDWLLASRRLLGINVEAKLHGESKVIQRCFDDNNDDNKR